MDANYKLNSNKKIFFLFQKEYYLYTRTPLPLPIEIAQDKCQSKGWVLWW